MLALPAPDDSSVNFADQEMDFAWRSHFIAACAAPLTPAARETSDTKGWTVFELPDAMSVPEAMIKMFKG